MFSGQLYTCKELATIGHHPYNTQGWQRKTKLPANILASQLWQTKTKLQSWLRLSQSTVCANYDPEDSTVCGIYWHELKNFCDIAIFTPRACAGVK